MFHLHLLPYGANPRPFPNCCRLILPAAALLLSPGLLCAQPQDDLRPVLTVVLAGTEACNPALLHEMQTELEHTLRPAGLSLDWRRLDLSRPFAPVPALVVLTLLGSCRSYGFCGANALGPLGWTHSTDGVILPFCEVHCDRVRHVLTPLLRHHRPERWDCLYGRALGRVAAHEIYHVLAGTARHAASGLAKPLVSPPELIRDAFPFALPDLARIRRGLLRRLPAALPPDPTPLLSAGQ